MSLIAGLGISLVAGFAGTIANVIPCLGQILGLAFTVASTTYISVVSAHLYGQFAKETLGSSELIPVG
jgi:hypothetical protein